MEKTEMRPKQPGMEERSETERERADAGTRLLPNE